MITPEELALSLAAVEPPAVLDVRWQLGDPGFGQRAYAAGHIPGAVFCDLDSVLSGPAGPEGRHPLPDLDELARWLRDAGVDAEREVCVYGAREPMGAARAWWLLRYVGHERVRVLDGGLAAWQADGFDVTDEVPRPRPGSFTVRVVAEHRLDDALVQARADDGVLLDARAPERYSGESEPIDPIAGHIPGALNAPAAEMVDADGRMLSAELLRARFGQLGITPDTAVGVYCGSGVTAATDILALALAGMPAALYAGSWSKWTAQPDPPVATGPDPR
ncbi:sulfurtransferase [Conexibacter woesei]|nr:sulfurtransferase [Conexibacter woesei]